jgi:hypothetical protein
MQDVGPLGLPVLITVGQEMYACLASSHLIRLISATLGRPYN